MMLDESLRELKTHLDTMEMQGDAIGKLKNDCAKDSG